MLALLIITFGFLSRIVVHTPNFTPVLSLALLGGVYLKGRQAVWVPLWLDGYSDSIIGFHDTMFYTWGSILLISLMGLWLGEQKNWTNILTASLLSSVLFFVVTNFGAFLSLIPSYVGRVAAMLYFSHPFFSKHLGFNHGV